MSGIDPRGQRPNRGPVWAYMLGGAVLLLLVYGILFRRGMLDVGLWRSPVRVPVIALLGVLLGWVAYRIDSRPR